MPTFSLKQVRIITEKAVDYEVVGEGLVVYRMTTKTTSGRRKAKTTVTEGITSQAGLSAFRDGAVTMPGYSKNFVPVFGNVEFRDHIRRHGWLDAEVYKSFKDLDKDPYTRFVAGEFHAEDIVFIEGSSHMVFDVERKPLPCAILFDYISAHMDNSRYDLPKALAILKARDDIRFEAESSWDKAGEVSRIPSYNADKDRNACLKFVWMPSVEDYRRMWAKCAEYETKYPSTERYRAVFDLDLLGLRAGGAALCNDFYASVESKRKGDRDDYDDED
jgi:hypothetical protein